MKNKTKECIGIIYFTVCLCNGMGYCGYHHTSADNYMGSGSNIKKEINEIGKENFRRIIIDHYCTKEERKIKEIYWIKLLGMKNKNIGWNIHTGGGGFESGKNHPLWGKKGKDNHNTGRKDTLEVRKIKSELRKGNKNPMHGKKGKEHPAHGRKHTPEELMKMSNTKKDKKRKPFTKEHINNMINSKGKPIQIDNKKFKSSFDASRKLNMPSSTIGYRLKSDNFPNYIYIKEEL